MAGRVLREPTFQHPFFLREDLKDAPEAGEGGCAKYGGKNILLHEYGSGRESQPRSEKDPPAAFAPMVFHLDDYGMTYSYY